jgi:L-lactate dehydrogenase complex protein LldE
MNVGSPMPVQLFATCLVEAVRPEVGLATVRLLERCGCLVSYPSGQTCCGLPSWSAGAHDDARAMARHTITVLSASSEPVVVPSGACARAIREGYPSLLAKEPAWVERARGLAARTFELSEFLAGLPAPPPRPAQPLRALAYHASCQLRRGTARLDDGARRLLTKAGAELLPLAGEPECCGFGGPFAISMSELSGALLERKVEALLASGAESVVSCDLGCLLHIEGALRRRATSMRALHIAEALAGEP